MTTITTAIARRFSHRKRLLNLLMNTDGSKVFFCEKISNNL